MQAPRLGTVVYLNTFFPNSLFEPFFALLLAGLRLLGIWFVRVTFVKPH